MKKVLIAGGSGFIGRGLTEHFQSLGWEVTVLSRSSGSSGSVNKIQWDGHSVGNWAKSLGDFDALINLCGSPVVKKWSDATKKEIRDSRILPTLALGQAIEDCENPPKTWINASAIGFYGDTAGRAVSEASPSGKGFLPDVCAEWEEASKKFHLPKTDVIQLRVGVVLGRDGGMIKRLEKIAKLMLGSPLGTGNQFISWIHLGDLCWMFSWAIENQFVGILNGVAPNPVPQKVLTQEVCDAVGRPMMPPVPAAMVRMVTPLIGIEPEVLLKGQRVLPVIAESRGFEFDYPEIRGAMKHIFSAKE